MKLIPLFLMLFIWSCNEASTPISTSHPIATAKDTAVFVTTQEQKKPVAEDPFKPAKKLKPNFFIGHFDEDSMVDTALMMQHKVNKKLILKFKFGNGVTKTFGNGNHVLGLTDLSWVGEFEFVPKGEVYWDNVDQNGDFIIDESSVLEKDKTILPHDAILIHAAESCGGGIIYFKNGVAKWIQQE